MVYAVFIRKLFLLRICLQLLYIPFDNNTLHTSVMSGFNEFWQKLFDTSDFPARWHCGKWSDFHGWLYIISDVLIWGAYFAIPLFILKYIARDGHSRYYKVYLLFAMFIVACGATHLLDAIIFWEPYYRLSAVVRAITAIVSWMTVIYLYKKSEYLFSLKAPEVLDAEVKFRKQIEYDLHEKNELLNEAQEIAKLGFWKWDLLSKKMYASEMFHNLLEVPLNYDLTFERILEMMPDDDRKKEQQILDDLPDTKEYPSHIIRVRTGKGNIKYLLAEGYVEFGPDRRINRITGTAQDVTEDYLNKQQMLEKNYRLERMNEELERFAYIASHDLQEPLRKIKLFSSLLERNIDNEDATNNKEYSQKISRAAERMRMLVTDMLNYYTIQKSTVYFEEKEISAIVDETLENMAIEQYTEQAEININVTGTIEVMPMQVGRALQNLIGNAIKYTEDDVKPIINISSNIVIGRALTDNAREQIQPYYTKLNKHDFNNLEFIEIKVSDNGIGFDESFVDKIFEVFQRLHTREEYEGTGIGLSICKKVAEQHHGAILAESPEGKGAIFTLVLPVSQSYFTDEEE